MTILTERPWIVADPRPGALVVQYDPRQYRVECVDRLDNLTGLAELWTELQAGLGRQGSLFLTWEWVSTWWEYHAGQAAPWLLLAWDRGGRLAGILPLLRLRRLAGLAALRVLAFPGSRFLPSLHQDVAALPDEKPAITAAFASYLLDHDEAWDILDLAGIARDSALPEELARLLARLPAAPSTSPGYRLAGCEPLPGASIDLTLADARDAGDWLSRQPRRTMLSAERVLARSGQVVYRQAGDTVELQRCLAHLWAFGRARRHGRRRVPALADAATTGFLTALAAMALARGWLRCCSLEVAGQTVAVEFGLLYGGVHYCLYNVAAPDWADREPSQVLLQHVIQASSAEGAHELDLGGGLEAYMLRRSDHVRYEGHLVLAHGAASQAWLAADQVYQRLLASGRAPGSV